MWDPIVFQAEKITKGAPRDVNFVSVRLVSGKESALIRHDPPVSGVTRTLEVGLGAAKDEITRRTLTLALRKIIYLAKQHGLSKLFVAFPEFLFRRVRLPERDFAELLTVQFELANFEFVAYKTPPPEGWNRITEVLVTGRVPRDMQRGIVRGQHIAAEVNACRTLANTPGGDMTPSILAEEARSAVKDVPIDVTVLDKNKMEQLGMGGILGVSRGSAEDPQFIIMKYEGGKRQSERPLVLVGKGVTFDTGGLNLKPSDYIYEMHMDMSGGAAVIHAVALAARLGIKRNIIGLIPAVENMPSGSSYRPGDVLKSLSGKTIEVLNTDAEGRIILADAITYAKRYNPRLVVDVATLTGASMAALGQRCSAVFTTDEKLERDIRRWGEESGDYVWPLPLWDEYEEEIKGTFGDIANVGKTRYGGAITAAKFLHAFAKDLECPWVHIDMAPRMTSMEGEYLAKGAVGAPVRLLVKLLEQL